MPRAYCRVGPADAAKGVLAALLGRVSAESVEFLGVIWAMIGRNWPVWLRFHGGGLGPVGGDGQ